MVSARLRACLRTTRSRAPGGQEYARHQTLFPRTWTPLLGYERACYHLEMPISVGGGTTANHSLPWVRWHVKNRPKASRWCDLLQGTPGLCALDRLPGPAIGLRWRRSASGSDVDVISKAAGFQIVCSLPSKLLTVLTAPASPSITRVLRHSQAGSRQPR